MTRFRKVRTLAQIKADERVESVSDERDCDSGYWVYLRRPYVDAGRESTCIHEDTVAECCYILNYDIVHNETLWDQLVGA